MIYGVKLVSCQGIKILPSPLLMKIFIRVDNVQALTPLTMEDIEPLTDSAASMVSGTRPSHVWHLAPFVSVNVVLVTSLGGFFRVALLSTARDEDSRFAEKGNRRVVS